VATASSKKSLAPISAPGAAGLIKDRRDKKWIHYSLDGKNGYPYAVTYLRNLRKWMNDDPLILKDRERPSWRRGSGRSGSANAAWSFPAGKKPFRFSGR